MSDKIYFGNCKSKFDGDLIEWAMPLNKIRDAIKEGKVKTFKYEGTEYLKVKICKKKDTDEYGKTHYVEWDSFDPKEAPKEVAPTLVKEEVSLDEDLPF